MNRPSAAALVAVAFILAGCGSSDSEPQAVTTIGTQATTTAAAAPAKSPEGYIDVKVGAPFEISNEKGTTATVTLLKVEINPTCTTQFGDRPAPPGTNVALEFDVQTTATPPSRYLSEYWFEELTPKDYNRKIPMSDDLCIGDREGFGKVWSPNSKYRGWVLLEVSDPQSSLLLSDFTDSRMPPEIHRITLTK